MEISNYIKTYSTSFHGEYYASLSTLNCLQGYIEGQQLQKHGIQSLLRQMANILGKCQFVVDNSFTGISGQFSSFAQSCPTVCKPMNHSTPGLPVHHQLLESTQTQVH